MKQITSVQNPFIKSLVQLQEKAKVRKQTGTFLIEGKREIELALKGGYELETILFLPEIISDRDIKNLVKSSEVEIIEISKEVYQKLAYRESTEGVLAVAKTQNHDLQDFTPKPNGLYLIADAIEKPGNIGALLRTADAANIDAVILSNPKTDLYNPNVIRSSVGCVFTNRILLGSSEQVVAFCKTHKINVFGAALQASVPYHTQDYKGATAILVGTEATGLPQEWLENTHQNIVIPMQGKIDSMNVSVAAAILLFEAKRQRGF